MIQIVALLTAIACLAGAGWIAARRWLPGPVAWLRRNPMLGFGLGVILASSLAWAADTKISALTATSDLLASKRIPAVNVVNTSNEYWTVGQIGGVIRRTITGTDTIVAADRTKLVEATSGTFTLSFTAAATLGDGFWFRVYNSGTGTVTLDPSGAETLDGQTTITLQPGVSRNILTNGTAFFTMGTAYELVDTQTFTSTGAGTWNKHPWARECFIDVIGAGGGGGGGRGGAAASVRQGGSGGGGGARSKQWFLASDLASSESLTVGAGGTSGTGGSSADGVQGGQGGRSEFGTSGSTAKVVAYGGGGGSLGTTTGARAGGAGGGIIGPGGSGAAAAFVGGHPVDLGVSASGNSGWGGGAAGIGVVGRDATWGGASGGGEASTGTVGLAGGVSYYGGGAGGSGGGVTSGNAASNGGAGGYSGPRNDSAQSGGGGAGGTAGGAGTAGANGDNVKSGAGGGGGASSAAATGGAGANGGVPGGGAGGGGGGTTVGGAGGTGGRGEIRVWCFGALDNFFDAGNDPVQFAANDNARWARLEEAA